MCGDIVVNDDEDAAAASDVAYEEATPRLDYEQFIRQHRPWLLRHIRRIADSPEQGEDALQEALFEAHQQWDAVSIMDRPLGWVLRVTEHKLFRLRHGRRRQSRAPMTIDREAVADASEAVVESSELWEAVRRLSPRQRQVVSIRYAFDLGTAEIAALLDLKESTVRSNLARGYARLRVLLTSARRDDAR